MSSSSSRLVIAALLRNRACSSSSSGGAAAFLSSSSSSQLRLAFDRRSPSNASALRSFSAASTPAPGKQRPRALVFDLLQRSEQPQTTAQLWEATQESIKSKRHLKSLLTSLKSSGKVKTTPNASGRSYGYSVKQAPRQKMEIE